MYRNKYLIAFYDSEDHLVSVFDSVEDIVLFYNLPKATVASAITRLFSGFLKHSYIPGYRCTVHFIPCSKEDFSN